MPRFRYTAFSTDGQRETGYLEAESDLAAFSKLADLGLTVTELVPDGGGAVRQGTIGGKPLGPGVQAELAEQLAVLLGAGLPAPRVAEIVARTASAPMLRRHFSRVVQLMSDGKGFAESMEQASGRLSPLFAVLSSVGEDAGAAGAQFPLLAKVLRRQDRIRSQITTALIYPAILLLGGAGMVLFMAVFLAPRLDAIFSSAGREPPAALAAFSALGMMLASGILPAAGAAVLIAVAAFSRLRGFGVVLRRLQLWLPVIGPITKDVAMSHMMRSLQLMLNAGVPLSVALSRTAGSFSDAPYAPVFESASAMIEAGGRAYDVFGQERTISPLVQELFTIGEETNTLGRILGIVAETLDQGVERRLQRAMAMLTPVLTLVVGGGIALVVASVMSAILSINDLAF
ncbi:type II secretion system F family protein [Gemmobacter nectariphilus]|uniref:type II secretion system F family protein n=1 Tax=Gemmobacter nectariphilus TaxID=220343 RepID=UPI00040E383F|nr:type II secretion system F family protein [Gemmobacter nectariphilus]